MKNNKKLKFKARKVKIQWSLVNIFEQVSKLECGATAEGNVRQKTKNMKAERMRSTSKRKTEDGLCKNQNGKLG